MVMQIANSPGYQDPGLFVVIEAYGLSAMSGLLVDHLTNALRYGSGMIVAVAVVRAIGHRSRSLNRLICLGSNDLSRFR